MRRLVATGRHLLATDDGVNGGGIDTNSHLLPSASRTIKGVKLAPLMNRHACLCFGIVLLVLNLMAYNVVLLGTLHRLPRSLDDVGALLQHQVDELVPAPLRRQAAAGDPVRLVRHLFEHYLPPQALDAVHRVYHLFVREVLQRVVLRDPGTGRLLQLQWDTSSGHEFRLIMQRIYCTTATAPAAVAPTPEAVTHAVAPPTHAAAAAQSSRMLVASPRSPPSPPSAAPTPRRHLVVDFGAMDGISGSNSFPFLQAGWDGVLVEAFPPHFAKLENNVAAMRDDRYGYGYGNDYDEHNGDDHDDHADAAAASRASILTLPVAIAERDGYATLKLFSDNSKTSNSLSSTDNTKPGERPVEEIRVPTLSVRSLLNRTGILCDGDGDGGEAAAITVLSIDIEGQTMQALADVLALGCRPRFVIVERDLIDDLADARILRPLGYRLLARALLNHIWEAPGARRRIESAECR